MKDRDKIRKKAKEIISGMSKEQKLAQLTCMFCGDQIPTALLHRFENGLGEIAVMPGDNDKAANAAAAKEEQETVMAHCGIPAIRHNEAVTGLMTADGTVFPSAIGLGASWDPDLVEEMADIIRKQMLSVGMRQALSPVMDVARDPRWGRVGETYGEDPTLCAAMSAAFTKGLQTDDLENGVIATGKHFLGYGMSEGGLNMAVNPIPLRELREVYAKPFQAAITEAGLASMMNSYGVIDGEMVIGSEEILTKLLRDEMGFDGVTVSDYMSINKMTDLKISGSPEEAGVQALKAGLDSELPTPYGYREGILKRISEDEEAEKAFDRAVLNVIEAKVRLGLFGAPAGKPELLEEAYDRAKTAPATLKAARESIVLVKNDGILPLDKTTEKIAVIGPHADSLRLLFGCYTYPAVLDRNISGSMSDMAGMQDTRRDQEENPYQMPYLPGSTVRGTSPYIEERLREVMGEWTVTILDAVREKCPDAQIVFEKGCDVVGDDRGGFEAAEQAARDADVVLLIGGGKYGWGSNCTTGEGIDTDRIGLPGVQEELAERIWKTGTPAVYIHMDAKPLSSEFISGHYPAVIENWFPGESGGRALADVLFGDYNPAGRLPMTVPRNAGQIPVYSSQKNGSGYQGGAGMVLCKYVEGTKEPLHYFGEGCSYTTFAYSDLEVQETAQPEGTVEVSCLVKNTGERDGEEVVQLYVTDELASMMRPVQELAGFCRVFLKAGESRKVRFTMKTDQFAFLDRNMEWIVEAGKMTVKVGGSSRDIRLTGAFEITDTVRIDGKKRGFYAKAQS